MAEDFDPVAPRDPDRLEHRARALLASDRVTAPTREALLARLEPPTGSGALEAEELRTLEAVAARLLPLGPLGARLDLARRLDRQLASGPGDGWRYADMAPDANAQRDGLRALDASARAQAGRAFAELAPEDQDVLLAAVQRGEPPGPAWPSPPARWFEELLAALVELAYGDVRVQLSIGYEGFADAAGWHGAPLAPAASG